MWIRTWQVQRLTGQVAFTLCMNTVTGIVLLIYPFYQTRQTLIESMESGGVSILFICFLLQERHSLIHLNYFLFKFYFN